MKLARSVLAASIVATLAAGAFSLAAPSCQTYVAPPTATINGLTNGILPKPNTPLVVTFSTPVAPSTVNVTIAPFAIDAYGNLPDEVDGGGSLDALVTYVGGKATHATATLSADHTQLTLDATPLGWLPTGPSLVLLVGQGLTSETTGTVLRYRERIPFSYPATCGKAKPTSFHSGAYFFFLQVQDPVAVPLKDFAVMDVNPLTGEFFGQFTAALRNSDPNRCSPACTDGLVCELPSQKCVEMSEPPVNAEEYPDYVWKATAPDGYTFAMHGCATDIGDAGAVNILTQPGVLNVSVPKVTADGLVLTAQFAPGDGGVVYGSGSLTATHTYAFGGTTDLGVGTGTLTAVSIPDADVPDGLPQPGSFADASADGASDAGPDGG